MYKRKSGRYPRIGLPHDPKADSTFLNNRNIVTTRYLIIKSSSPYYSQVLLVQKPDSTFRMCVDYRALNDCTPDANWPIPNITEMLRRIGQHKPKLFGIMDLTQGYHQAPFEHNTKAFTAFTTFSGVYEFTRLI